MAWTLITGGAKRLGAHLAVALSKAGYDVVIQFRNSGFEVNEVVKECRRLGVNSEAIFGDFSSTESTLEFVAEYNKHFHNTKNLINNVGNYLQKSSLETDPAEWTALFQANLHAPFILTKGLLQMIKQNQGNVINIGVSGLLNLKANTSTTGYKLSKTALWGLTRSMALELAKDQVRVNMVSPGYLDNAVDLPSNLSHLPMDRSGSLDEVCRTVLFLLDPSSQYITGQNIEVAGGVGL